MSSVVVTGGTGRLGRELVPRLRQAGHDVRVLSRQPGADRIVGDVRTGAGLAAAVDGVDLVVHAVVGRRKVRATEIDGTRNVVEAARNVGAHLVYLSIVGVDRHRFPYYRYKFAAEQMIEGAGIPFTIQRATQFHSLIERFLSHGVFFRTPNLAFQPVDPGDVAERIVQLVEQRPHGHAEDFGGPEVLAIRDIARARTEITNRNVRLVRVPRFGLFRDFDDGRQLAPDHRSGTVTWADWLRSTCPNVSGP